METTKEDIVWFDSPSSNNLAIVGGKNASLGEMTQNLVSCGIAVPMGFATSTKMYRYFIQQNKLEPLIRKAIKNLNENTISLNETGKLIRNAFIESSWPESTANTITTAYNEFCVSTGSSELAVAIRSSATAEDLPEASFAGQQESFLNIKGVPVLLDACKQCYASLFTDRAISYRIIHGFDHLAVALSIGIQKMVNSDSGSSGVMFTLDTETGFDKVVAINAIWGLGENIVQGKVDPDDFCVFKPLLNNDALIPIINKQLGSKEYKMIYGTGQQSSTIDIPCTENEKTSYSINDSDVLKLARWGCLIEEYYQAAMDIEWAKDGETGELYIVQARPETVQSRKKNNLFKTYQIEATNKIIASGIAIGQEIISGTVCHISTIEEMDKFIDGSILVTQNTDPDWLPLMKNAAAIITDHGGRTSHAAIVCRELGLPAILATGNATTILKDKQEITVSCAEGDKGFIYPGKVEYTVEDVDLSQIKKTKTKVMLNLANPATAFQWWRLPADGIGLVRMEFIINNHVKIHPMALLHFDELTDQHAKLKIKQLTHNYHNKTDYFVDQLANGLARFAALFYPANTIIRMSDFKTNEYAHLLGGEHFEAAEENPMLGFRGASRYYSPEYQQAFVLECKAIKKIRETMGFTNVTIMIPFCRTVEEAGQVLRIMADNGLNRGQNQLQIYMMCEIPANVVLAQQFAELFDGFSIGSNDLTQLTLGVDRDSSKLAVLFSESNAAVLWMIKHVITEAHNSKIHIGLCGQAPSDHPEFTSFLVQNHIDSISVSPDSFFAVKKHIAEAEIKYN